MGISVLTRLVLLREYGGRQLVELGDGVGAVLGHHQGLPVLLLPGAEVARDLPQ